MSELRPFALLRTGDQWLRCSYEDTALDPQAGIVTLASTTATADTSTPAPPLGAGLAFDHECRLYHSTASADGSADRVERILWKATDPLGPIADQPPPLNLFDSHRVDSHGDFAAAEAERSLVEPRGLAVDCNDRLFVAERGSDRILIYDLWSERLVRRVALPGTRPCDLASHGNDVYAVLTGTKQIVRLTASSGPAPLALPNGCTDPSRVAVSPSGAVAILEKAATANARVWFADGVFASVAVPMATDLEWESDTVIVVARRPGADFHRYQLTAGQPAVRLPSLRGRDYDGLGIVALPVTECSCATSKSAKDSVERRIGYWTAFGFRTAVLARQVYARSGRVTTFRLDSGAFQTVWGRLFVDACLPEGTDLRAHFIVADDADDETPIVRGAPVNLGSSYTVEHAELSPPLPPAVMAPDADEVVQPLHERESGRELPWTAVPGDRFETFEAPINAPAGRYLWITLELRGNTRVTPKVRCLRAEHPSHDYLRRLPRTFSRSDAAASFLLRYLAIFEGFLGETEARGVDRHLLLDPCSAPADCLPWLASFVGLTLDDRWASAPAPCGHASPDARRRIIKEAAWLFRYRGTLPGLTRFIELYVGSPVIIIEKFRLRGVGAVVLGDRETSHNSIVGVGFRIGGAVSSDTSTPDTPDQIDADAFRTHAHRFTVMIPAPLTDEQLDVVTQIIKIHRPAHTSFDICTAGAGMRVGRGLMLAVSSIIGPTGAFSPFQIAATSVLGRDAIVGRPAEGGSVGNSRLGATTRIG
ncbi:MAG: hypothetical protein LAO77_12825 [Acidobacteriia bacterium]|nr:hypothetical protein [Terriglobia bacterium]